MQKEWKDTVKILKNGGVAVIPTDTLYGLVSSAFSSLAISKIYKLKERDINKKMIILISSVRDLKKFGIKITKEQAKILKKFWPGEVSIILSDIAFRLPNKKNLIYLIKKVGPIVAPSANTEGNIPAKTIEEAIKYFGDNVDIYIDEGEKISGPSTLIKIENDKIEILREGKIKIKS